MSQSYSLVLACLAFSALPFVSGCSQGSDSLAIAAGQGENPLGSVTVTNTLTNPVPTVDSAAKQPVLFSQVATGSTLVKVITVPAGKRLVIESISSLSHLTLPGSGIRPVLRFFTNGTPGGFWIAQTSIGQTATQSLWISSLAVRLYVDPSTDLTLTCETLISSGPSECAVMLSGYLVDLS